jgi:TPP-dependent 2-oxoacid decarboxylase
MSVLMPIVVSFPETRAALEASDLVLNVGPLLSDSNTGAWTRNIPDEKLVILGHDFCSVHKERFEDIHFLPVLEKIIQELEKQPGTYGLPRKGKRIEVRFRPCQTLVLYANKTPIARLLFLTTPRRER